MSMSRKESFSKSRPDKCLEKNFQLGLNAIPRKGIATNNFDTIHQLRNKLAILV